MVEGALFCDNIGNTTDHLSCCFPNDQNAQTCLYNFNQSVNTFTKGCLNGDCLQVCSNLSAIYQSDIQDDAYSGNGFGPIRRYLTCANVPAMAGYLKQDVLERNITSSIGNHISANASDDDLKTVTSAVTQCLTTTCRSARDRSGCRGPCSAVNLLTNSTAPNIQGVNDCLFSLCNGGWNALPYADADVVGIGVFASYIMQCMLVVILWFGLSSFQIYNDRRGRRRKQTPMPERMPETPKADKMAEASPSRVSGIAIHQHVFENFLVQFHKAQCYFSATIQIASLSYGIFGTDMLITFMLTPLATNGVLPVVFAFVLLFRCGKSTMDVTLLTTACWLLSSIVYWILYASMIPINQDITSEQRRYRAYQQFMYKLSAIDACGGYSALAVCPSNFVLGKNEIADASHNLRVLTPIIWAFSTVCLLITLTGKLTKWIRARNYQKTQQSEVEGAEDGLSSAERRVENDHPPFFRSRVGASITYWLVTLCFLAGIGMQLSLLSIGTSLHMMNRMHWSFGQIVAVTIWAPPLLGYIYDELKETLSTHYNVGDFPK